MILGASLPGMIFPAQRPAEGSNSYHYGSYATRKYKYDPDLLRRRFHTTMVLTQLVFQQGRNGKVRNVSIPLWFLRNQKFAGQEKFVYNSVSIPLWFLRNRSAWLTIKERSLGRFHTTMVLTQHLLEKEIEKLIAGFHTTMVLTQRNATWTGAQFRQRFHTTMVLTQQKQLEEEINLLGFHTTMVLTQPTILGTMTACQ